jgi:hypothetical protein
MITDILNKITIEQSNQEKDQLIKQLIKNMDIILDELTENIDPIDNKIKIDPFNMADENLEKLLFETDRIIEESNLYLQKYDIKIIMMINLSFDEDWSRLEYKNDFYDFYDVDNFIDYWYNEFWPEFLKKFNIPIIYIIFIAHQYKDDVKNILINNDT